MKGTKSYGTKHAKYVQLVNSTESALQLRDVAIKDFASKINDQPGDGGMGFMNRSLTMVCI